MSINRRTSADMEGVKAGLSGLLDQLEAGSCEEIVILRAGRPVARLLPIASVAIRLGVADGKFVIPYGIDLPNPLIDATFNPIDCDDAKS